MAKFFFYHSYNYSHIGGYGKLDSCPEVMLVTKRV